MFKVQHIGIPTADINKTKKWYKDMNQKVVFETTLKDGVKVVFVNAFNVTLEFYQSEVDSCNNANIKELVINTADRNETLVGPNGEVLKLQIGDTPGLDNIVLNTTSPAKTASDLEKHGFIFQNYYYIKEGVKFLLNEVINGKVGTGVINHIAFDDKKVNQRAKIIKETGLPIVEGINFLPFFDHGVIFFVTENHDGLRIEYNQIIVA